MLVEKDGMWYKVLVARYDKVRGWLIEGGREGSIWWKDLVGITRGGVMGWWSQFDYNLRRRFENGIDTHFWTDLWLGGAPLSVRFPRLFELSEVSSVSVAAMFALGWW